MHAGKPCPMMLHQQGHGAHAGHAKAGALKGDNGPSSQAYDHANMVMHQGMDIVFTGDADIDFLRGMIAHHQGAVDMAKVQLQYGKNAQVKKLSREIIRAQELEISWMKGWLAQLEGRPHTADTKTWIGEDSMLYK
ncbi:MAG: DUF305 domain-containing protein [Pseudomonadaceae bacterium]|nr:DUF305 domain-containing protein [Pseudomonadaceae bacterium]